MSVLQHIQNSFNGGEVSSRMMGRTDTAVYQIAVETAENFAVTVEGPIVKRPGTIYVADADETASWLGTFKPSLTQHYVLEWGEEKVRFFTNDALIESAPGVPYVVTTPYAAADAPAICSDQSHDRLYLAHGSYPSPAALKRTGAAAFAHETLTLLNGPFADQNSDEAITVSASGVSGSITLTASAAIFESGHEDSLFYLEAKDFSTVKAWEANMKGVVVGDKVRSDGKIYQATALADAAGITGQVPPTHEEGAAWDGQGRKDELNDKGPYGVQWTYLSDKFGIARIDSVTDSTHASATVIRQLPDSLTSVASWRWAHSAISDAAGWPGLVKLWKGRMLLVRDLDLIASVANDYGGGRVNFQSRTSSGNLTADLSFRRTLDTPDLPHWIAGDRQLLIGTPSVTIAVKKVNSQAAFSGDNIEAEPQIFKGSQPVTPAQIGASTLFIQRGGRKILESGYDFGSDRYVGNNINVWARHIIRPGALQFAYQDEPEELLHVVRGDGQLAVHPHNPAQEIKGFTRYVQGGGGTVISAVTIAAPDGQADQLWMLVERGGVKRVLRQAAWREDGDPVEDAFFVDEGITIAASAGQTHFTGAAHLAGLAVAVLANGASVEGVTVDGAGAFDIPEDAAPAHPFTLTVGLPFTATCTLLRPELKPNGQSMQATRQRVVKVALRMLETIGIRVGPKGGPLDNLIDRSTAQAMGDPTALFTGDSPKAVSGNFERTGQVTFTSSAPLPATIICAMPRIDVQAGDP